ncbi:hypothetical protein [Subtercola sp. RTI3]|uniref:hypothetical protein n=1 Tax=Subtercola sp. RTI3 TaxID=3048639 RepID=UPI002B22507B|nr:hypothetical protein [Subtercola sp. RTI3]MEA9986908.1 hypothetical protein [Subtercola sp. RTI3]
MITTTGAAEARSSAVGRAASGRAAAAARNVRTGACATAHGGALRRLIGAAVTAGVLLGVSGCAGFGSTVPTAGPTTAVSAPTTAASSPAPTADALGPGATPSGTGIPSPTITAATEAIDLTKPGTWLVDYTGIGPARITDTVGEARASLASLPEEAYQGCNAHVFEATANGNVRVAIGARGPGETDDQPVSILFAGGGGQPESRQISPHTAKGISTGSTEADVLAAYPGITGHPTKYEGMVYEMTNGDNVWLSFVVDHSIVIDLQVSTGTWDQQSYCD